MELAPKLASQSAEALSLRACRSWAAVHQTPLPPVPGEGFTPPLPLPATLSRQVVRGSKILVPIFCCQNGIQDAQDASKMLFWKHHHLIIDFRQFLYRFSTNFWSIFGRFRECFGMHVCIQFFYRFLIALTRFSLSKIQMCCSAETLQKSISLWFLQCFVKVAFFRTRQSKHQIFAEPIKFRLVILIENSSKNRLKINSFGYSESDPIFDRFCTPFLLNFGIILEAFGVDFLLNKQI